MSISYTLEWATPIPVDQLAEELRTAGAESGVLSSTASTADVLAGTTTASNTWVRIVEHTVQPWHPVPADLGFSPAVSVSFRLDTSRDVAEQQDAMIRVVAGLLDRLAGDLVLHLDYEQIWLLRRDGELSIGTGQDIWPEHRLALLSQPYRRVALAFAE